MRSDSPDVLEALLPFPLFSSAANSTSSEDIIRTAESAGQLATLVSALKAADLVEMLKGAGPFTMLAPTDAAFVKLPAGVLSTLLKPENKELLLCILNYHVVRGNVKAASVMTMSSVQTLSGQAVTLSLSGRTVKINDSAVVKPDIVASNGTIHCIDKVLLPN